MMRFGLRETGIACVVALSIIACWRPAAWGYYLDKEDTIKFGLRSYVNARIGTEQMGSLIVPDSLTNPQNVTVKSNSFPQSPAGHLRQNRFFIDAELEHDVTRLIREGFGPLQLLNDLPFKVDNLKYHLIYRAEADGIYEWGPTEYSGLSGGSPTTGLGGGWLDALDDNPYDKNHVPPSSCTLGRCPDIGMYRHELRKRATVRNRLYQAFIDAKIGNLFLRVGRQVLVWGETDAFRLLDNINPIDSSFGGFLIDLDERRVPLDMIRANYYIGDVGDSISEMTLEGYAALDSHVSYFPGTPVGSPWTLPNTVASGTTRNFIHDVPLQLGNTRGGARLQFDAYDVTWSVAHYYSYSDLPTVQTCVHPGSGFPNGFPFSVITSRQEYVSGGKVFTNPSAINSIPGCPEAVLNLPFSQERPLCTGNPSDPPNCRMPGEFDQLAPTAYALQNPARIQVSGGSATTTVPATIARHLGLSGEPVIRTELAYIKDEPAYSQSQLDPFKYDPLNPLPGQTVKATGGILKRDSINFVLGVDTNQFIRSLNAVNSFFITTQFFYKHILNNPTDSVLPVTAENVVPRDPNGDVNQALKGLGAIEPIFVHQQSDQFLQTLLISTSYRSGTINPSLTFFYDWSGSLVYIPSITFLHDPFRFTMQYDILDSGALRGNSGTSLLRDRDNILFQFEYVI